MRFSGRARRALAILLTGVLSFEAAFGNGLATALADQLPVDQSDQTLEVVAQEEGTEPLDGYVRTEPWDWTGDTTHLTLSSKGISVDNESAKELVDVEQKGKETDHQLPDYLPAALDLTFELNPAAQNEVEGAETSVSPATSEPGDYFTVDLPEDVTLASADSVDVFRLNDENNEPTAVRVAEAQPNEDGMSLRVTLVETPEETVPAVLLAGASLSVNVATDSLDDDATVRTWTLQVDAADEGIEQKAELTLPGIREVTEALLPEDQPETPDEEKDDVQSANEAPAAKEGYFPSERGVMSKSLTITWADNNNRDGKRPKTDEVKKGLSLTFSIDGGKSLPLTLENAKKNFGISMQEELAAMVSVSETGVGIYTAKASDLYTKIVDEAGKEYEVSWGLSYDETVEGYHRTEDESGNPCYQLLDTFTYHVVTKVGDEELDPAEEPLSNLEFSNGGQTWSIDYLVDHANQNGMSLTVTDDGTYKLTAPAFGTDGLPLEYALTCPVDLNPDDVYEVSHDNAASPNHGDDAQVRQRVQGGHL